MQLPGTFSFLHTFSCEFQRISVHYCVHFFLCVYAVCKIHAPVCYRVYVAAKQGVSKDIFMHWMVTHKWIPLTVFQSAIIIFFSQRWNFRLYTSDCEKIQKLWIIFFLLFLKGVLGERKEKENETKRKNKRKDKKYHYFQFKCFIFKIINHWKFQVKFINVEYQKKSSSYTKWKKGGRKKVKKCYCKKNAVMCVLKGTKMKRRKSQWPLPKKKKTKKEEQ